MTPRNILLTLLGASGVGVGMWLTGDAPVGDEVEPATYEAILATECSLAQADDVTGTAVDCQSGTVVTRVKWRGDVPAGYELVGETREVTDEPDLRGPVPLPLASDCVAGELRKDVSARADGSQWWMPPRVPWAECGKARIQCRSKDRKAWISAADGIATGACWVTSPIEFAGREAWSLRAAEKRPDLSPTAMEVPP